MATEYKLSYTAQEIDEKLGKIDNIVKHILSAEKINALDALFKAASYIKDVSAEYAVFCEAFGISEPDAPSEEETTKVDYLINWGLSSLNDMTLSIGMDGNKHKIILYSLTKQDKVFAEYNGSWWCDSERSPIKIPVGAVTAHIDVPSGMKHGAFIAEPHDTEPLRVKSIVDVGWVTDGRAIDVSGYNDGNHYFAANIAYISNADIPADFDISVLDFYFADANGNRMP